MTAIEKLTELMDNPSNRGLTGSGLGRELRRAGFTADMAMEALLEKGFTVQKEDADWGVVLHVSTKPLAAAASVALALMGASSEVAWHNQPST
jgi:hypothetical protein